MNRRMKWFVAAHVVAVLVIYAVALSVGGGWADPSGVAEMNRLAALAPAAPPVSASPLPVATTAVQPAADAGPLNQGRLPRHELELRAQSQDTPAPWSR